MNPATAPARAGGGEPVLRFAAQRYDPQRPLWLYGAGRLAAMSLAMWPEAVARPLGLIDQFRGGGRLDGLPVRALDTLDPAELAGAQIALAAVKADVFEIAQRLGRLGLELDLTVYDVFEHAVPERFSNGWRLDPADAGALRRLAAIERRLADETSRATLRDVVAWRAHRELAAGALGRLIEEPQRFLNPFTAARFAAAGLVVDGGCFDGGLLIAAAARAAGPWFGLGFEPDPANLARCHAALRAAALSSATRVEGVALAARGGTQAFLATGDLAARLVEPGVGNSVASTVALDEVVEDWVPAAARAAARPILKLHVEGAELAALEGARDFVARHHPLVMVNGSHNPAGLIDVPEWLAAAGYRDIRLRAYALFGEGVTLYALD